MLNKIKYYCWACDFKNNTGEGNLARLFTEKELNNNSFKLFTPDLFFKNKILNYKYFTPFIGIIICWYFFLKKKKPVYINYLPLWNFLIFLFLPPQTILGPITGGSDFKNNNEFYIRKYLFPLFYKTSTLILKFRYSKLIFSTDLLKKYIPEKLKKKSKFNFVFNLIKKRHPKIKKIDFVIYYKKHKNKISFFPFEFLQQISMEGLKIIIVGDYLNIPFVKNKGFMSNNNIQKLLSQAKYTIASGENIYSLFIIESINNHVKILIDKLSKNKINYQNKYFIPFDFKKKFNKKKLGL